MPNNSKIFIEKEVSQIREDYGYIDHEIDLFDFGKQLGIKIQTQTTVSHGISGALIREGNDFLFIILLISIIYLINGSVLPMS